MYFLLLNWNWFQPPRIRYWVISIKEEREFVWSKKIFLIHVLMTTVSLFSLWTITWYYKLILMFFKINRRTFLKLIWLNSYCSMYCTLYMPILNHIRNPKVKKNYFLNLKIKLAFWIKFGSTTRNIQILWVPLLLSIFLELNGRRTCIWVLYIHT